MGLFLNKTINNHTILGLWHISESSDELFQLLRWQYGEVKDDVYQKLQKLTVESRKQEWLATRVLLNEMMQRAVYVGYKESGQPYLINNNYSVSISHTKNFAAIIVSALPYVGIDIEKMSDRIYKVAPKFMHVKENKHIDPQNETFYLYLHWCAKETLFKLYNQSNVNFIENLRISEIKKDKDFFKGSILTENYSIDFDLHYLHFYDYLVVWACK